MRLLIVEDEVELAESLARGLGAEGYEVTIAATGQAALAAAKATRFDFVLLDLMLPDMSGIDVSEELRLQGVASPVIMVTALDDQDRIDEAARLGACDYITKPLTLDYLEQAVEKHLAVPL